jgi:predicted  nucleic acid-binding Zn-ribbon protein
MIEVNWAEKYQESEAENQQLHRQRGEMYAEKLRLEERVLVKNSSINTLRRQRGELEAKVERVMNVYRQAKAMGGGHSRETQKLTEALGAALEGTE